MLPLGLPMLVVMAVSTFMLELPMPVVVLAISTFMLELPMPVVLELPMLVVPSTLCVVLELPMLVVPSTLCVVLELPMLVVSRIRRLFPDCAAAVLSAVTPGTAAARGAGGGPLKSFASRHAYGCVSRCRTRVWFQHLGLAQRPLLQAWPQLWQ